MKPGKLQFPEYLYQANQEYADEVPSGSDTHTFVEKIIDLLFPFRTKSVWNKEDLRLRLTELESELEGDIDLRGFLGLDPQVPKGYTNIRVMFKVKTDPDNVEKLKRLAAFSPVYNTLIQGTQVDIQIEPK